MSPFRLTVKAVTRHTLAVTLSADSVTWHTHLRHCQRRHVTLLHYHVTLSHSPAKTMSQDTGESNSVTGECHSVTREFNSVTDERDSVIGECDSVTGDLNVTVSQVSVTVSRGSVTVWQGSVLASSRLSRSVWRSICLDCSVMSADSCFLLATLTDSSLAVFRSTSSAQCEKRGGYGAEFERGRVEVRRTPQRSL